jgi:hypothetical protein
MADSPPPPRQPIEYASRDDHSDRIDVPETRTFGKWFQLLAVWAVGLVVWAFYIFALLGVFFWLFG